MDGQIGTDLFPKAPLLDGAPERDWGDEPTAVFQRGSHRIAPAAFHGHSLEEIFERARAVDEPLPVAFVLALYTRACRELAGAGRRPPRHREDRYPEAELAPHRIRVALDGRVRIDWSPGKRSEDADRSPADRHRSYLSPEQLRGLPTNGRSDLYSLALSIGELLVLKRLSDGGGVIAESEGGLELAELLRSGGRMPREIGSILLKSLALDVEERPSGVTSLAETLESLADRLALAIDPAIISEHLRRLFVEQQIPFRPPTPPLPLPSPELAPSPESASPRTTQRPAPPSWPPSSPMWSAPPAPPRLESEVRFPPRNLESRLSTFTIPPPLPPADARSTDVPETATPTTRRAKVAIAAALLIAVATTIYLQMSPGRVFTSTAGRWGEPLPQAVTLVDGEQKCSGATCMFDLAPGIHEVSARAEGYAPQFQLIAVHARETGALNFRLERGGSTLRMSGSPEGAAVFVDGERLGALPLHADLAPGTHRLRVEAEHYLPEEREIDAVLGDTKSVTDIALHPMTGKARFEVRTPGASVALLSSSERKEHLDLNRPIELDLSQKWTVEAKKDGYRTLREPLDWGGAQEKTFVVALERAARSPSADKTAGAGAAGAVTNGPGSAQRNPDSLRSAMIKALEEPGDGSKTALTESGPLDGARGEPCQLSFNSIPVSNVFLDSVRLGITPILKASARPGAHLVVFVQGESKKSTPFTCRPGEAKALGVNLSR